LIFLLRADFPALTGLIKKADPVGIGLLKEGVDASTNLSSRLLIQTGLLFPKADLRERPVMCIYTYRRKTAQKVTGFFKIFSKFHKNSDSKTKRLS